MLGCVYGPEWWKRYSPPAIAAILFVLVARSRRGATMNMQRILGTPSRLACPARRLAHVRRVRPLLHGDDGVLRATSRSRSASTYPEHDELSTALADGHGAVVVTGHFGNWDVAAKGLGRYGRPVNMVMAREVNASTNEYVRQAREAAGVQVIYSDSSVFSSLNMVQALRRNEVVAIQLDRSMHADGTRLVPFFGAPASFPSGPFVLARVAGAPLIPVFLPRLGTRHYAIRVCGRFDVAREARDSRALARVMTEVAQVFEAMVREFPTQWFQFSPFWSAEAPLGETALHAASDPLQERLRAQR